MVWAGLEGLDEESVGGVQVVFAPLCSLVCVDLGVAKYRIQWVSPRSPPARPVTATVASTRNCHRGINTFIRMRFSHGVIYNVNVTMAITLSDFGNFAAVHFQQKRGMPPPWWSTSPCNINSHIASLHLSSCTQAN